METLRKRFKKALGIKDDEKVLLITRKHWFKALQDMFLPLLAFIISGALFFANLDNGFEAIFIFSLLWLIFFGWLIQAWTNHYLDIWIVTNKRIIHIEQHRLFNRTKSTIRIEKIQNVSIQRKGFLEEMLNYGTINVETAGYKTFVTHMEYVPDVASVAKVIMSCVDSRLDSSKPSAHTTSL